MVRGRACEHEADSALIVKPQLARPAREPKLQGRRQGGGLEPGWPQPPGAPRKGKLCSSVAFCSLGVLDKDRS